MFENKDKKWKDKSENAGHIVDIFAWTWNILGGRTENTSEQQKMVIFVRNLLSENYFENILATFCCSKYGSNVFEAVQKIATDQRDYHKCSLCVIVCWRGKIYQAISMWKKVDYYYQDTSGVNKKAAEVAQNKEQ